MLKIQIYKVFKLKIQISKIFKLKIQISKMFKPKIQISKILRHSKMIMFKLSLIAINKMFCKILKS